MYHRGDVRSVMASMPDGSVDLVACSPPFLALRSYLPADHPDKALEIGSEPTPGAFLDTLLALTAEWGRLITPTGSIAVELGDTYSGAGGYGSPDSPNPAYGPQRFEVRWAGRTTKRFKRKDDGWPEAKSLALIPQAYALSLAYGRNIISGEPSPAGRWRVRNVVRWVRPNPPVGALGDKVRPATSEVVIATRDGDLTGRKDMRRWFDIDAERVPATRKADTSDPRREPNKQRDGANYNTLGPYDPSQTGGAPLLDWWEITPGGYTGAHYAVFPVELPRRLVSLMCPFEVCRQCGEPRRRIVGALTLDAYRASDRPQTRRAVALADAAGLTDEHIAAVRAFGVNDAGKAIHINTGAGRNSDEVKRLAAEAKAALGGYFREFVMSTNAAPGSTWSDCGHDSYRPGVTLDPFGGSGTTAVAAAMMGRDSVLIDLDARNVDLARQRLRESMLLLDEQRDGDTVTWIVDASLPGVKGEHPDQQSLFGASA